ncbi:MAG: DUF2339 domain-containing protein, partial [Alphaproteobacteria bacterium]|nr:DUF2339 domain-containing protein [Alphaproteobacteria bacterium]
MTGIGKGHGAMEMLFSLVAVVLGIIALSQISKLDRQIFLLKKELARIGPGGVAPVSQAADNPVAAPVEKVAATAAQAELPKEPAPVLAAVPTEKRDVEKTLASRWFVWIGGVAVALAGLLFVKYAHDNGLIPPVLRVLIGLALAAGLVAAGEFVRKSRGANVQDFVPAALSAAGLVMAFGVVYAAYGLYGLVSPAVDFIGLGLVALAAFWLSRVQGPLIAALGLLGAYSAPALVTATSPNAWSFFPYLVVIVAASFFTLRERKWWWLGYLSIAGAFVWGLLWIYGVAFTPADVLPIALFAVVLGVGTTLVLERRAIFDEASGTLLHPAAMSDPLKLAICGMGAGAGLLAAQVLVSHHGTPSLVWFLVGMALIVAFSWFKRGANVAALLAAGFTLFIFLSWPDVAFYDIAFDERGFWISVPGRIEPPRFMMWMMVGLVGFTCVGALGVFRKAVSQPWAALVAGASFLYLFGAWARADFVWPNMQWALLGAVLAFALLALAWVRRSSLDALEELLGASCLLMGAALLGLFALDRSLDGVWMTMAVAALALGFAFVVRALPVRLGGSLVAALASFAALRLFVAREIWHNGAVLPWGGHWPVYGYGVPAVLALMASRVLPAEQFMRARVALEGIALALGIALVSLELRTLIGGGIGYADITLLEMASHILAWLGAAYGLAYRQSLFSSFVSKWGARVLLFASCAGMIGFSLVVLNPLLGRPVEGNMLFNSLTLAYLAAVPLLALMARKLEGLGLGRLRNALGILALVMVLAYVTLQVKMWFQGKYLIPEFSSDAESYSMSVAWLLLSIAMFVAGLKLGRQNIR